MKSIFGILTAILTALFLITLMSCEKVEELGLSKNLTEEEVVQGLKEALNVGAGNSTANANKLDGYYKNLKIKIPFPPQVNFIDSTLRAFGQDKLVDDFVLSLNRAAEDAAIKAKPIFIEAITSMNVQDGFNILKGNNDAATIYLRSKTYSNLQTAFQPGIKKSLDNVGASQAWSTVIKTYNAIPFIEDVNPDLSDYTTKKGLDGLFILVADEETKIRTNASARVSDILKKVFDEKNQ